MAPKSVATAALSGLKTTLDRLAGSKKGAKSKKTTATTPATIKKDNEELRKAFEKVQELYSSEFLSHIADVKKILDALGKHKTACASIPSLGDHINRCLVDILDYLNLSIGQAKNSELVHLNEIVESCVELMSSMVSDGFIDKGMAGPTSFQKLFRIILNGNKYKIKNKRMATDLISDLIAHSVPNHAYLCSSESDSFLKKCVHRLHEVGDYQLQAEMLEILRSVIRKKGTSERLEFIKKVFEQEESYVENFENMKSDTVRTFLLDFNKEANGFSSFPKIVGVSTITYQGKAADASEGQDRLWIEFNQDSLSFEAHIQQTDNEASDAIVFLPFGDMKDWKLEKLQGGAAELSVVVATQNGRTTTNRRASFEVHGSDADNFGRLAARIFKKRRVETTSKNPVPEEWQNEESVADPENEQPALPLAKPTSSRKRSIAASRIRLPLVHQALHGKEDTIQDDDSMIENADAPHPREDGVAETEGLEGVEARSASGLNNDIFAPPVEEDMVLESKPEAASKVLVPTSDDGSHDKRRKATVRNRGKVVRTDESDDEASKRPVRGRSAKRVKPDSDEQESEDEYKPVPPKKTQKREEAKGAQKPSTRSAVGATRKQSPEAGEVEEPEASVKRPTRNPVAKRKAESPAPEEEPLSKRKAQKTYAEQLTYPASREDEDEKEQEEPPLDLLLEKAKAVARKMQIEEASRRAAAKEKVAQQKQQAVREDEEDGAVFLYNEGRGGTSKASDLELRKAEDNGMAIDKFLDKVGYDVSVSPTLESRKGNRSAQVLAASFIEINGERRVSSALMVPANQKISKEVASLLQQMDFGNIELGEESPILSNGRIEELDDNDMGETDLENEDGLSERFLRSGSDRVAFARPLDQRIAEVDETGTPRRGAVSRRKVPPAARPMFEHDEPHEQEEQDDEDEDEEEENPLADITLIDNISAHIGSIFGPDGRLQLEPRNVPSGNVDDTELDIDENMVVLFKKLGELVARRVAVKQASALASADIATSRTDKGLEKIMSQRFHSRVNVVKSYILETDRRSRDLIAALAQIKPNARKDLDDTFEPVLSSASKRKRPASTRKNAPVAKARKLDSMME